jgi:DNA-binding NtrC family response regulator
MHMTKEDKRANADALAIRWSLESSYARLYGEAYRIVVEALEAESGHLRRTATRLGVDRKTVEKWMTRFPGLRDVMLTAVRSSVGERRGRLPREIEENDD